MKSRNARKREFEGLYFYENEKKSDDYPNYYGSLIEKRDLGTFLKIPFLLVNGLKICYNKKQKKGF